MLYHITRINDLHSLALAQGVRKQVFVCEQGVDPAIEQDGQDNRCCHVAAWHNDTVVGTARLLPIDDGWQVGRMAVLPEYRGKGVGGQLLTALLVFAKEQYRGKVFVHAQLHAEPFYRRFGFQVCGPTFMEAGICHVEMVVEPCCTQQVGKAVGPCK